jgi:predicted lipoprotein with Yx(FWY)xxD motif
VNKLILAAVAATLASNVAIAQSVAEKNGLLTDAAGRTLYTFTKDAPGKSHCNGGCAAAWPPFLAKEGATATGNYSVVTRDDGAKQWAINGKPLYHFAADTQPGDAKGEGQGGVWFVVRTAGAKPTGPQASYSYPLSTGY